MWKFILLIAACGTPEPGDTEPDSVVRLPTLPTPETHAIVVALDSNGCIPSEEAFGSESLGAFLEAGTCLTDDAGRRLRGEVSLDLTVGRTTIGWVPEDQQFGLDLVVRVLPEFIEVPTRLEPPLRVEIEIDDGARDGAWQQFAGEPARPEAGIEGTDAPETLSLSQSGPSGAAFSIQEAGEDGPAAESVSCENPIVHTVDIGDAGDVYPKPTGLTFINPRTAQIIRVITKWDGIGNGEKVEADYPPTGETDFEVRVRHVGGVKQLQIVTCYKNLLSLRMNLQPSEGELSTDTRTVVLEPDEGGTTEACPGARYLGSVEVLIRGCNPGGFKRLRAFRQAFAAWRDANYDAGDLLSPDLVTDLFTIISPERWFGKMRIAHWGTSVQDFPIADFFPGATVTYGDRLIEIDVPCPSPQAAVLGAEGVVPLDPLDLQPLAAPVPLSPFFEGFTFVDEERFVAWSANAILIVGPNGELQVPVSGLLGAVAPDPTSDAIWVSDDTSLFSVDAVSGDPIPAGPWASFNVRERALRSDGGEVYTVGLREGMPALMVWDPLRSAVVTEVLGPGEGHYWCLQVGEDLLWATNLSQQQIVQHDPVTFEVIDQLFVPEISGCPALHRDGSVLAVPMSFGNDQGGIGMLAPDFQIDVLPVQGVPISISAAPGAAGYDFGFLIQNQGTTGTVANDGSDWQVQDFPNAVPNGLEIVIR